MTKYALPLIAALLACGAHAADAPAAAEAPAVATAPAAANDCTTKAEAKKLAGAAKNSFMKKCEREAKVMSTGAACESKAAEKKLAGAAKKSFVTKCTRDAAK